MSKRNSLTTGLKRLKCKENYHFFNEKKLTQVTEDNKGEEKYWSVLTFKTFLLSLPRWISINHAILLDPM